MRKTKIVCTIGPACESEEMLEKLCLAGMNVARLNFSHGTYEEHQVRIDRIRRVREKLGLPISIMLDTKGPEYRIGTFEEGSVVLKDGAEFTFTTEDISGDENRVSVSYKKLAEELAEGDIILVNDGLIKLEVLRTTDTDVVCRVIEGGELSNRKSMSFPGKVFKQAYLSKQDKSDILFGIKNEVDFIACSFVSTAKDLKDIHKFLKKNNAPEIELIAKIENQTGYDNIEEICEECSGVMVARGDMGVEVAFQRLPVIQKDMISKCRMLGKRVITATEMLESMIHKPRPTRAETSDVANAVYDGSSAVMLSGETAAGDYPVEAVQTMAKIAEETESHIDYRRQFKTQDLKIKNETDAISHATCGMALDLEAKAIVACSVSGMTARMVSRFRCPMPIIGLTTSERTWRRLSLSWGVIPKLCEVYSSTDVLFYEAKRAAKEVRGLDTGDTIVITGGIATGEAGKTNQLRIEHC